MKKNKMNESRKQKSKAMETTTTENASRSDAESRAIKYWELHNKYGGLQSNYGRKSLEEGWKCGGALDEVQEELPHGDWGKWLKSNGISQSTADRLRRLSKSYDITQLGEFTSVDQALRAIPKRRKPAKKLEPEGKTEGKASSRTPEEATGADGTPQVPVEGESAQKVQELRDRLRKSEEKRRDAEESGAMPRKSGAMPRKSCAKPRMNWALPRKRSPSCSRKTSSPSASLRKRGLLRKPLQSISSRYIPTAPFRETAKIRDRAGQGRQQRLYPGKHRKLGSGLTGTSRPK